MSKTIMYVEDVQSALECSAYNARHFMQTTGQCIKIGKKLAVPVEAFYRILNGNQFPIVEFPEQHQEARICYR